MKNNRADIHYRIARFEQKRSNRGGIYYRMARFEQYNLHPGRNRHYQSGRQRDPWHIRERMVMVPVPTDHVDIDVQFDIYDTIEKKHSSYYTYRFASSFKDIDDLMAEYYTIDQSEFKENMDEPEQILASVIKALKKEQR